MKKLVKIESPWGDGGSLVEYAIASAKASALEDWLDEHPGATDEQKQQAQDAIRAVNAGIDAWVGDFSVGEPPVVDGWEVARSLEDLAWLDPVED